ncbi:MAG: hypothetical protein NTY38_17000 [Acidobacteria bacterium]|nr:hypothetical protein [Acidobacteriota bacterium]
MHLILDRRLVPQKAVPWEIDSAAAHARLEIAVIYTSRERTLTALARAGALADQMNARLALVVPQVVPYPLPLSSPPVLLDFSEQRFQEIAAGLPVETSVRMYLCRDQFETLPAVLKPHSLVVLSVRQTWWPTAEKKLVSRLRRAGHEVILTETE